MAPALGPAAPELIDTMEIELHGTDRFAPYCGRAGHGIEGRGGILAHSGSRRLVWGNGRTKPGVGHQPSMSRMSRNTPPRRRFLICKCLKAVIPEKSRISHDRTEKRRVGTEGV